MKTRIYFMGYMGSGKSTLGKKIASAIGYQFIDLDRIIEEYAAQSISTLFEEYGEAYFRTLETKLLKKVITQDNIVIALGGGTPCSEENIKIITTTGASIYLKIPPKGLQNRLENSRTIRPKIKDLKGDALLNFIQEELNEREVYYNQANMIVDGQNYHREGLIEKIKLL